EADIGYAKMLGHRVQFVVTGQVGSALADDRHVPFLTPFEHGVGFPLVLLPGPDRRGEFAEVDFRIEVGGEVAAVAAGVDVDDIDRFDFIEIGVQRVPSVGVDHTGVEACAQYGGYTGLPAGIAALPFIV